MPINSDSADTELREFFCSIRWFFVLGPVILSDHSHPHDFVTATVAETQTIPIELIVFERNQSNFSLQFFYGKCIYSSFFVFQYKNVLEHIFSFKVLLLNYFS